MAKEGITNLMERVRQIGSEAEPEKRATSLTKGTAWLVEVWDCRCLLLAVVEGTEESEE